MPWPWNTAAAWVQGYMPRTGASAACLRLHAFAVQAPRPSTVRTCTTPLRKQMRHAALCVHTLGAAAHEACSLCGVCNSDQKDFGCPTVPHACGARRKTGYLSLYCLGVIDDVMLACTEHARRSAAYAPVAFRQPATLKPRSVMGMAMQSHAAYAHCPSDTIMHAMPSVLLG
jgi:hypothetical protein